MSTFWIVLFAILAIWSLAAGILTVIESWTVARQREHLEVADWQAKVEAMRRMQDEDGAA
jgi:diketogulonate reductase-like aldo/keto reductase